MSRQFSEYVLIIIALYIPLAPYWFFKTGPRVGLTFIQICLTLVSGSVLILGGAYAVKRYVNTGGKTLVAIDGFTLGFGVGSLLGKWSGLSDSNAVFPGLAGALVITLGLLHLYERFVQ